VFSTLGALSPIFTLKIVEVLSHKEVSLEKIFKNIRFKQIKAPQVLLGVFLMPCLFVIALWIYSLEHNGLAPNGAEIYLFHPEVFGDLGWFILLIMPIHFCAALITSPLFEEPGWRGFALENLQTKMPRWVAGLIVGSYWWLWHQGMNIAFGVQPTFMGYLAMLLDSLLIDAIYNKGDRNIFAAMLAHQSMGIIFIYFYPLPDVWYYLVIKLLVVVFLNLLLLKPQPKREVPKTLEA
jgi:membrane protease YdiL (CAAX protease family)